MSEEVTLTQLAAEMAQLRQQIETVNQRLDMIYGAVTRLAEAQNAGSASPGPSKPAKGATGGESGMAITPEMMMDPSSMLDSLRHLAVGMGLDVSQETVDRLKSHQPPQDEANDGQ